MILTIKGADFSGSGLGTNTSVSITLTKGTGVSGSKVSLTLEKNQVVSSATVIATGLSLQTGYENLVVTVTMNGSTVSGWYSNGKITIPSGTTITGNIKITANATKTATGDEPVTPTMYTFTINPTPSDATVALTASGYTQSGNSITVPSGTSVSWSVSKDGYTTQSGTHTVTKTESRSVTLSENGEDNVLQLSDSLITRVTPNVNIMDGKSVGSNGVFNDDQTYLSYEYTIPYDGTIYFDPLTINSIYVSLWHSGTNIRYRKSENNLPLQDSKLTVSVGDKIVVTITKATASLFKMIYENGIGTSFTEQLVMNKSSMTVYENQTAGGNSLTTNEAYNSWGMTVSDFEKGYLYMSDFSTSYTALLIISENGNVRYRITGSEDTIPKDINSIATIASGDTIYVSQTKAATTDFKIHFLTEK